MCEAFYTMHAGIISYYVRKLAYMLTTASVALVLKFENTMESYPLILCIQRNNQVTG